LQFALARSLTYVALSLSVSLSLEATVTRTKYNFDYQDLAFNTPGGVAKECVDLYATFANAAFLKYQASGGTANEPTLSIQCVDISDDLDLSGIINGVVGGEGRKLIIGDIISGVGDFIEDETGVDVVGAIEGLVGVDIC
jgi:hypothetical protein